MRATDRITGYLLSRDWRDTPGGVELSLWAATDHGPLRIVVRHYRPACYIASDCALRSEAYVERAATRLRALNGTPVDVLRCTSQAQLRALRAHARRQSVGLHESDLKPVDRYLMQLRLTASFAATGAVVPRDGFIEMTDPELEATDCEPALQSVALDIETGVPGGKLYCIGAVSSTAEVVFMLAEPDDTAAVREAGVDLRCYPDEAALLRGFFAWFQHTDPDLVLGWNVVNFDLSFIARKCAQLKLPFDLGRGGESARIVALRERTDSHLARIPGRVVLDGIESLRSGFWKFDSFALDAVATQMLGRGKRIESRVDKIAQINHWFAHDKAALAAYNLEDCRLVREIFDAAELVSFEAERSRMTGLALGRFGGSVAAFDNLYLPQLKQRGYVAPDVGQGNGSGESPGGYVMDSAPGLYDNVLLLDFKSLYPSIIRSFHIDPLALATPGADRVPGFDGASFSRAHAILPDIIETLWARRDAAKQVGNRALSQAVKILMNSFYGVLGTDGCRFFDPRLTSSITRRGHEIITRSRRFIEQRGYRVIYGDTDSLFVHLGADCSEARATSIGHELADALNDWWTTVLEREHHLGSYLEVELESVFARFLMPTVRGAATGSKKRYAGCIRTDDGGMQLVFKGLETVRSDWTPLARRFQRELYRRVFLGEPFADYVRQTAAELESGRVDAELVYRKRLRRPLNEYRRNIPPHVQAARKATRAHRWVSYVITPEGPEPLDNHPVRLDYDHYRDRQLKPVADGILHFLDTSFERIVGAQLNLF